MATAENKTRATTADPVAFVAGIEDARKRADAERLLELFGEVTDQAPVMWGASIIGYGSYHYRYDSGREGDAPMTGFSPRKQSLALYVMAGFDDKDDLLTRLGKHSAGRSCLNVKRLDDIDLSVLRTLIERDWQVMCDRYGPP